MSKLNGGAIIGECLAKQGIPFLFALCGGHISPILVASKREGIQVIDVRDEVSAVFAADAVARMTGTPGVAAVTAGPGVTNTMTAVKNAQMAQSPLVLFGGATATVLRGRGSLQDIDQIALMRPVTKWAVSVKTLSSLAPTIERAFEIARSGVPGPVFIEVPVDLLYDEDTVRGWYMKESGVENPKTIPAKALKFYLNAHLYRQFRAPHIKLPFPTSLSLPQQDKSTAIEQAATLLRDAKRPALVIGSQALVNYTPEQAEALAIAVRRLGIPTFLGGGARGLLGQHSDIQFRHKRSAALKTADVVVVAGFPFDFRLGYGRSISPKATLIAANLSRKDLRQNRTPDLPIQMHSGDFLQALSRAVNTEVPAREEWFAALQEREDKRDAEIAAQAEFETPENLINPLKFFQHLEKQMADDAIIIVDGGDFVGTGSYILRPRKPLSWLDPGVFGTLGVGGGFALGAALCRPKAETWLVYGDGSSGYSLAEFDTCVRHGLAPIAVIGTDGSWGQIAREQTEMLGDNVGTVLLRCDYHTVAEGYGAVGLLLTDASQIEATIAKAKQISSEGKPVVVNIHIAGSDFRKGSMSM